MLVSSNVNLAVSRERLSVDVLCDSNLRGTTLSYRRLLKKYPTTTGNTSHYHDSKSSGGWKRYLLVANRRVPTRTRTRTRSPSPTAVLHVFILARIQLTALTQQTEQLALLI